MTRCLSRVVFALLLGVLLADCGGSSAPRTPTPTRVIDVPTIAPLELTPTPDDTPAPTRSAALDALLTPGPTAPPPDGIFFRVRDELWHLPATGDAFRVVSGRELGPWAQARDGSKVAFVAYRDMGGSEVEELLIAGLDGADAVVVHGPMDRNGDDGPVVVALDWAWDAQALAVAFSDGGIATMSLVADPFAPRPTLTPLATPEETGVAGDLAWAPNGAGVAYRYQDDGTAADGATLYVTPLGDAPRAVVGRSSQSARMATAFDWLPGRGRIAFVEGSALPATRLPGSLFTVAPDGGSLELLLSAGQFAPAASIGALVAAPDGRDIALIVNVPGPDGLPQFHALWILSIDSGDLVQAPIEAGYRATDLVWTSGGLVWRGVDRGIPATTGPLEAREEPFILVRFDPESGDSSVVFQSQLAD